MLSTIEGVYRKGKVELSEIPFKFKDETKVLVVFLDARTTHLIDRGIDVSQAADLRDRFATFIDDWDNPEMDVYDDYDSNKSRL